MKSIKTRNLQISISENLRAEILNIQDIDWYIENIFRPFFYEYLEYKPSGKLDKLKIKANLTTLIGEYTLNNVFNSDIRLILKQNGESVGGITIIGVEDTNEIELAYWVIPEYQSMGIATSAVSGIINYIEKELDNIDVIKLQIIKENIHSIKLANKLGFKKTKEENTNIDKIKFIYSKRIVRGRTS